MSEEKYKSNEIGIVYISESLADFSEAELSAMADEFARSNAARDITGYLWYSEKHFVQYVEGGYESVKTLIESIEYDPRHIVMLTRAKLNLPARLFPHWDMKYITQEEHDHYSLEWFVKEELRLLENRHVNIVKGEALLWKNIEAMSKVRFAENSQLIYN